MKTLVILLTALMLPASAALAQVDQIKSASSSHSSGRGDHRTSGGGGGGSFAAGYFFADIMFSGIVQWQQQKLSRRQEIPTTVSLDVMLQGAIQPSSYYILTPRIRANWGLFSTDFRLNYLLEESLEGTKAIRTDDWQILQLNVITTPNVLVRVGGGTMHEAFGDGNVFPEWTGVFQYQDNRRQWGGTAEYRGAEVRKEVNAHVQYKVLQTGLLHGYATFGAVYQQYYSSIQVWGVQAGMIFRLYRDF